MKKRVGFTLIELLVVIGIIALLASILMPNLINAQEQARRAACLSNMHSAGLAIWMYTTGNNNTYPTCYQYIDGSRWDTSCCCPWYTSKWPNRRCACCSG